ncbi:MAG: hypothetical protein H6563_05465 [Lewinellaceae bacterium]|nr:hypothetical protein [Lewinellaceae bacterium]
MTLSLFFIPIVLFLSAGNPALSPDKPMENPKLEHARQIFDRLVEARGNLSMKPPVLEWTVEASNGAYYLNGTNRITMEERAYDVCAGFGDKIDDALAFILSHELIHYYKQHGWEANFGEKFADLEVGKEVMENLRDIKQQETEADLQGGFLAYTAGFNTVGIAPDFLQRLYDSYPKWPKEASSKYPSLEERILVAKNTEKELSRLIQMFETANMLVAVGHLDDALEYYNFILANYKSRELVNNVGVVACMRAMKEFEEKSIRFGYPLELDGEARLRLGGSKGINQEDPKKVLRDSLLHVGVEQFNEAIFLDKEYQPARLNLACAYALLGLSNKGVDADESEMNYDFASLYAKWVARNATKKEDAKLNADAVTLMGVIAAETGQGDAAGLFTSVLDKSPLAEGNLRVLKGEVPGPSERKPQSIIRESIDGFNMDRYRGVVDDGSLAMVQGTAVNRQWGYYTTASEFTHSKVLVDFVNSSQYAFFHMTEPGYEGATGEGIKVGASRKEILAKYLTPDRELQLPNGHLLVYGADGIIFWLDETGKLKKWVIYRIKPV